MRWIRRNILTGYAILALLYLFLPIFVVIVFSFNNPKGRFNYTWQGFTLKNWTQPFAYPGLEGAIKVSIEIAFLSAAVIAGITYNFLPFMVLPLYVSLEQIDHRLIEAAEDLYASRPKAFYRITLPLSLPGVFAGVLLTFIPAAGDFINAQLLGTPQQYMIGNVIQSEFLSIRDYPTAAALSFVLMAAILVIVLIFARALGTERLTVGA